MAKPRAHFGREPLRERVAHAMAPLKQRVREAATTIYQKTIVELILRRKHLVASKDGRHIPLAIEHDKPLLDTRRGHSFVSNTIRTSRYTIWDFLPKQFFFQFSRVGNFYFLCVGIPQTIPGLSTTGNFTTILPLLFFVLLTVVKEGYDDYRRHRLDKVENAYFATVLGRKDPYTGKRESTSFLYKWNPFITKSAARPRPAPDDSYQGIRWVPVRWRQIKVGDIIRLARDEPVPADVALLHSDGEDGLAYIETMALDGETSLKSKQVPQALQGCGTIEGISRCRAEFVVEDPNPELYRFDGRVTVGEKALPLTLNEIIYRGSILRNTPSAIGVVINTGEECKIRMNANQHPKAKKPALERVNNRIVVALAIYVVIQSVGVSMGYVQWQQEYERYAWYLDQATVPFYQIIIAFIIMFNNVVPLALYITLEIVKIGQLFMLNSDVKMYDPESDTPARCNTNTILENLGQVGYIFSDKTGTLTDNVMKFRKISVAGTVWLHEADLQQQNANESVVEREEGDSITEASSCKKDSNGVTIVVEQPDAKVDVPLSPVRMSMGERRSSSHWRSAARPDHVQPDVNTSDLLEHIRLRPDSEFSKKAKEYILAMALCHTCLPENRNGQIEYQASSPDELALVRAAQELGYVVVQRTPQAITLQVSRADGTVEKQVYEILDVIEFSSLRKRMSIILRYPDGRISIICKGADSSIIPRLKASSMAQQKAHEVQLSAEMEHEMHRRSEQQELRNSFGGRPSLTVTRDSSIPREADSARPSFTQRTSSFELSKLMRRSGDGKARLLSPRDASLDILQGQAPTSPRRFHEPLPSQLEFVDTHFLQNEADVFAKCFKHLDDFATEGLRTLLFAQRFIPETEYLAWKEIYTDAIFNINNREELIEAAAERIEQYFDLVGASAIEDKLQKGVPETIEKLRRANIKIWMLTGDKRETAINIAHSARLCRPGSDIFTLDADKGSLDSQLAALAEDLQAGSVHSVVVIDGFTLGIVEKSPALSSQFYSVMLEVDSVICCRASPAQKALLVRTTRSRLRSFKGKKKRGLTLAIGDGANDLAMISASHVGVGISGKEGLQAARVADYSIAQFRFLQRLLLVHGRWNYVRTAKFILCTFWKEMFFYLPTAAYQRHNGYTGTSLYEATSLTVFNTLFTSLCTICMGVWEQDLRPETLLAVPELYIYGQRNEGLNFWKFFRWMALGAAEGVIVWYGIWAGYGRIVPGALDPGLYALGTLAFTVGVLWINWKLFIFETHFKSSVVMFSFFLTTWGWFAWLAFLDGVFAGYPSGTYNIRDSFTHRFGRDALWWSTVFIMLGILGMLELAIKVVKRQLLVAGLWKWPPWGVSRAGENVEEWNLEIWQELEQDPVVWEKLKKMASEDDDEVEEEEQEAMEAKAEKEKGWVHKYGAQGLFRRK
ncbi:hypothetical protein S40293_06163 [Stachybotrys chartarum IBT 40293]|nr:hypothetical protein S40293_06163 [Stachybotrys chartarum IBT 40293]